MTEHDKNNKQTDSSQGRFDNRPAVVPPAEFSGTTSDAPLHSYRETIDFLYQLRWFGAKLGLRNTRCLAALAGHPERKLRFIHVAGTNGKGSTCAMLESIYRQAGLRVGLFTSPHLVQFRERIQVNRNLISEEDIVRLTNQLKGLLAKFSPETHPTFFEVVTVLAFCFFAEQACDLVVCETGLGGRLDATNIITPMASLITNVHLDHQQWLGNTISQIAAEKAGIVKPEVPVITAADSSEALNVISSIAAKNSSTLTIVDQTSLETGALSEIKLPLPGRHQKLNAALAVAAVHALRPRIPVTDEDISKGLQNLQWPGRIELEHLENGQTVVLDGAHNPAGAAALRDVIETEFTDAKPAMVIGILKDKDWRAMCRILAPLASSIYLVPVQSERTSHPDVLMGVCAEENPEATACSFPSLEQAFRKAANERFIIITGSLYLVGEALELLHLLPGVSDQKNLNEYQTSVFLTGANPSV
ncbi:MAG: bifunctional folylpolyglutamate synthase/dihydrofolate synthase [Verrucomicrobia bacterium]|nr:bifunctional folylpolyglutamate synthase/dihydrofolate synthase [Verrucomicrobiota bacterium]MCF7707997.1 bifunctional folylpolyglutamate synthase/dihydrofolate synthase [Verrucomicrobiota bacterium]